MYKKSPVFGFLLIFLSSVPHFMSKPFYICLLCSSREIYTNTIFFYINSGILQRKKNKRKKCVTYLQDLPISIQKASTFFSTAQNSSAKVILKVCQTMLFFCSKLTQWFLLHSISKFPNITL